MTEPTGPHALPCPNCGESSTWEQIESQGECDDCYLTENPDQLEGERLVDRECAAARHPLIHDTAGCACGHRLVGPK